MMVAHRKGRDNGLVVSSAPVGVAAVEATCHHEAKAGVDGLSITTIASAQGACVGQTGPLGAEEKSTRGEGRRGQQASGASASAESK